MYVTYTRTHSDKFDRHCDSFLQDTYIHEVQRFASTNLVQGDRKHEDHIFWIKWRGYFRVLSGSLLFILAEGLLFVLLNKYSRLGKVPSCVSSPLNSFQHVSFGGATKQEKMRRVVIPMHIKQDSKVQHTLSLWETACTRPCAGSKP